MPAAIEAIPAGSAVLIDANILVYALLGQSVQCGALLRRCAGEEVYGVTTWDAVGDAVHRLMLREGFEKGLIPEGTRNPAKWLKKRPGTVAGLTVYQMQAESILELNVVLLETTEPGFRRAGEARSSYGLLTRDSLLVAAMRENGIGLLVSNDPDFDRVDGLTRYYPSDLVV